MLSNSQALSLAFQFLQAGRVAEAEQICRSVIATDPNLADAWQLLGLAASQASRFVEAKDHLLRALALNAQDADIHNNLGLAWQRLGRFGNAVPCLQAAIDLRPNAPELHYNLAVVLQSQGKLPEAIDCYRRAIALQPDFAAAYNNLGNCLQEQGQLEAAIDCLQRATTLDPQSTEAHNNLGNVLLDLGRLDSAERAYRRALELDPQRAQPLHNLGLVLHDRGDTAGAQTCFQQAITLDPNYLEAHLNLGNLFQEQGRKAEAVATFERALQLDPRSHDALYNIAVVLQSQAHLTAAEPYVATLLRHYPGSARGWSVFAQLQQMRGQADAAVESFQRAVALSPSADLENKLLFAHQYASHPDPQQLLTLHRRWDETYARGLMPANLPRPSGGEKLRIGFVSKDFLRHPISSLALPALEAIDKSLCSISCYSDSLIADEFTARWRNVADTWRDVVHQSDESLAAQIQSDQIDILVDLIGHTGNRMLVFARKPAPIQVTWLGYVGATGLSAMDYLLADRFYVPPGDEIHYSEKILRLPHAYACYEPPPDAPDVAPLPALRNGFITFGCFNNPAKYSPLILAAWAEILRRLPSSRLILKYGGLENPSLRTYLQDRLQSCGVKPEQLVLEGRSPPLLPSYNRIDLALDTQPYSGGLTTCEALWMGVPVITFPGRTFAGRHSTSYLANAGLGNFIATDLHNYIELATTWATRLSDLAAIRRELRNRLRNSPICNTTQFATDLLTALQQVSHCKTIDPPR